jgi:1,2-dihydroxy-3-keto-5-methylthiopentene dioxygenase
MTRLRTFDARSPRQLLGELTDHAEIARTLNSLGVRFERWYTDTSIRPGATQEQVIDAYRADIDRLMAEGGYQAVDVVSVDIEHPQKTELRQKFLSEHQHSEDEVRFFVAGQGLFNLHLGDHVHEVLCTEGDLISVPADTRHWFDMGPNPHFVAIRLFTNPAGWVAKFTGDAIALDFPRLDN